jgi:hypothetical protein
MLSAKLVQYAKEQRTIVDYLAHTAQAKVFRAEIGTFEFEKVIQNQALSTLINETSDSLMLPMWWRAMFYKVTTEDDFIMLNGDIALDSVGMVAERLKDEDRWNKEVVLLAEKSAKDSNGNHYMYLYYDNIEKLYWLDGLEPVIEGYLPLEYHLEYKRKSKDVLPILKTLAELDIDRYVNLWYEELDNNDDEQPAFEIIDDTIVES